MKHGMRSGHVLLPGDNVAEFRKLRYRLFHLHQPRTVHEATRVETIANNTWRAARCRLEQQFFKYHLGAAMSGHPDTAGSLSSADLHQLHHRCTDSRREERSLELSVSDAEASLALLQKQRTQNLNPGRAAALEDYTVFLAEGEPAVEEPEMEAASAAEDPTEGASGELAAEPASASADGGKSKIRERTGAAAPQRVPKHWSRRQRDADLRRMGVG